MAVSCRLIILSVPVFIRAIGMAQTNLSDTAGNFVASPLGSRRNAGHDPGLCSQLSVVNGRYLLVPRLCQLAHMGCFLHTLK